MKDDGAATARPKGTIKPQCCTLCIYVHALPRTDASRLSRFTMHDYDIWVGLYLESCVGMVPRWEEKNTFIDPDLAEQVPLLCTSCRILDASHRPCLLVLLNKVRLVWIIQTKAENPAPPDSRDDRLSLWRHGGRGWMPRGNRMMTL